MQPDTQEKQIKKLTPVQMSLQMLKFTLFSISAGIIQAASFTLFKEVCQFPYWLSYGLALVLSVLWNFTFNRRYTFRSVENVPRAMTQVFLYYCVFTPLSMLWGDALTKAGWLEYLVLGGTMVINFVTEYLYQRFVVYRFTVDTNELAKREQQKQTKGTPVEFVTEYPNQRIVVYHNTVDTNELAKRAEQQNQPEGTPIK